MKEKKWTEHLIQRCVAGALDYRKNMIIPNIYQPHEMDLLMVNKNNFLTEIEIKTSISDLKADFGKRHGHDMGDAKYLYYAIPSDLYDKAEAIIPERAGIIVFWEIQENKYGASIRRKAKVKSYGWYRAISDNEKANLGRLAAMKIWNRKRTWFDMADVEINQLELPE